MWSRDKDEINGFLELLPAELVNKLPTASNFKLHFSIPIFTPFIHCEMKVTKRYSYINHLEITFIEYQIALLTPSGFVIDLIPELRPFPKIRAWLRPIITKNIYNMKTPKCHLKYQNIQGEQVRVTRRKEFVVVTYQALGKNIKKDTWEGPKSIELVEKNAHRLGTFFGMRNHWDQWPGQNFGVFRIRY